MVRRTRVEMEKTRALLLKTAREVFCEQGYAAASMDDLTARVNLTRGALYHHFGDKKGLLAAVVAQIDAEMDARLQTISEQAYDGWQGFRHRCRAYLEMALEPEYQQIVLRDSPAVLGGSCPESQRRCLEAMERLIANLIEQDVVERGDPSALAALIYGSLAEAAMWIADGDNPADRLTHSTRALELLLRGLLKHSS